MTQPTVAILPQITIKVDGTNLDVATLDKLISCQVDISLGMPDMAILQFTVDPQDTSLIDTAKFDIGKTIQIMLPSYSGTAATQTSVMQGEVVVIEPSFNEDLTVTLTITAYDKGHRLSRKRHYRSFVNVTDSDIVSQIASGASLSAQVATTSYVNPYEVQGNITDMEYLQILADRNQRVLLFRDNKVYFKSASSLSFPAPPTLTWGLNLFEFHPRMSGAGQVSEVNVKSWDHINKQEVTGTASTSTSHPTIGYGKSGKVATSAFGTSPYTVVGTTHAVSAAEAEAKQTMDRINSSFITANGICYGEAKIVAGASLTIQKVGTKFSGTYVVSSATHRYVSGEYTTEFSVSGSEEPIVADLVAQEAQSGKNVWNGVYPAVVTNNTDPDNYGRVKLKFPWLDDAVESFWARVSTLEAGNQKGVMYIPEVNDEVLVAFEFGDLRHPYVLGSLWNGTDAPPFGSSEYIANGAVVMRTTKTRTGNEITFYDGDSDKSILIKDASGNLTVKLDGANKQIIIEANDTGGLMLKSSGDIVIDSAQKLQFKCTNLESTSTAATKIEATGTLDVKSSAITNIKGSMVNIN